MKLNTDKLEAHVNHRLALIRNEGELSNPEIVLFCSDCSEELGSVELKIGWDLPEGGMEFELGDESVVLSGDAELEEERDIEPVSWFREMSERLLRGMREQETPHGSFLTDSRFWERSSGEDRRLQDWIPRQYGGYERSYYFRRNPNEVAFGHNRSINYDRSRPRVVRIDASNGLHNHFPIAVDMDYGLTLAPVLWEHHMPTATNREVAQVSQRNGIQPDDYNSQIIIHHMRGLAETIEIRVGDYAIADARHLIAKIIATLFSYLSVPPDSLFSFPMSAQRSVIRLANVFLSRMIENIVAHMQDYGTVGLSVPNMEIVGSRGFYDYKSVIYAMFHSDISTDHFEELFDIEKLRSERDRLATF